MSHASFLDSGRPAPARRLVAHATRFLDLAAEGLTAVSLIAGGVLAYGYLPPL